MNGSGWLVPTELGHRLQSMPSSAAWFAGLPELAADLAARWQVRCDGPPWSGFWSAVWPVVGPDGTRLAMKVTTPDFWVNAEQVALRTWAGRGAVRLYAYEPERNALLLERLDGARSLETLDDVDQACLTIAGLLAELHTSAVPVGIRTMNSEAARIAEGIANRARTFPGLLPQGDVDHALQTLAELQGGSAVEWLLHNDCHFLNVLHTIQGEPGWRAIDPFPMVGPREWELIPLLRNRWPDAHATGSPDRALRRRVDQVTDVMGGDRAQARAYAQAVAVDNLLDLLPTSPQNMFVAPYRVMASWSD